MTGMPCCCVPPECPFDTGTLLIAITGMTAVDAGTFIPETCCFMQCFTYNAVQPYGIYNIGDTMTFDKSEVCVSELFYFPTKCETYTQAFWSDNGMDDGIDVLTVPSEPAYIGCCVDAVAINRVTVTARERGGIRFLVSLRKSRVCVTIQLIKETCAPDPPVTKYILTWTQHYEGFYHYVNYEQDTTTYSYTVSNPDCWTIQPNTSSGTYPYVLDWDGTYGIPFNGSICRQKLLTALPTTAVDYTFNEGDSISLCSIDRSVCIYCDTSPLCINSGPTGFSEPYDGYCNATVYGPPGIVGIGINVCRQHKFYFWNEGIDVGCFFSAAVLPPVVLPSSRVCCVLWSDATPTGTTYFDIVPCDKIFTWNTVNLSAGICGYYPVKNPDAAISCFPTYQCPACPLDTQGVGADVNLVVTVGLGPVTEELIYGRIISMSRTISCSGYVQQSHCFAFNNGTVRISTT